MTLKNLLLGRRLANREQSEHKLGVLSGVPALGLDGLGSSSYGPEAALAVLIPLGAAGTHYIGPLTILLLVLLGLLYISYWQTIAAYPAGGGAYTVAKENLGTHASLLAAAALMIDYVLNVAVGISAGVGALVSVFPLLRPSILWLCLLALLVITLVNLRGTVESGLAFALPTYLFLASFLTLLAIGVTRALLAGGPPRPVIAPPHLGSAASAIAPVGAWLLIRAFASGCTAMTGVEAVSNGVSAFREPGVKNAHGTLTAIVVSLGALLGGIAYLVRVYGIGAMDQTKPGYQSVLSQLAGALVGHGFFYYLAIGSLLAVLTLSANTSFVDFPRLCRLIAQDRFLPTGFAIVGHRLVFSVGILFLTVTSGALLVAFGGITDRLIPLFAVGAFLAFTLSQAGMVMHWWNRRSEESVRRHLLVNGAGAAITAVALLVIVAAKFMEGAWITLLALPSLVLLFKVIRRYYDRVGRELRNAEPFDLSTNEPPVVVIPTESWNRLTRKAVRFGMRLSPEVIAVHLSALQGEDADQERGHVETPWREEVERPVREAGLPPPRLVCLQSPYRRFLPPLLDFIAKLEREHPGRTVAVIVPELIKEHWWQYALHNSRAKRLRRSLLRQGGPRIVVIGVPWHLEGDEATGKP